MAPMAAAPTFAPLTPEEQVTLRAPTGTAPTVIPPRQYELPSQPQPRRPTSTAADARFVRRAALLAAALGAVCGAVTQLLVG